jgi:hypothetical protein
MPQAHGSELQNIPDSRGEIMKTRSLQAVIGGLVLLAWQSPTFAQNSRWAEGLFSELSHDFGVVARGADVKHRLKITNNLQQTVHIAEITTSCGCTAAKAEKETLASGESTFIELTMNSIKFEGHKPSSFTVVFDRPSRAEVRVALQSYIRRDVVLTPGGAQFGSVAQGEAADRTLHINYAGRNDWKIREVICKNPQIQTNLVETQRGGGNVKYDLHVALKDKAPLGAFRDQMTLVTNDAGNPYIPILIEGLVEAEFSVNPELVSFGTLAPGERKTVNVIVRGKKPFKIVKVESEASAGLFETRLPKDAKPVQVLPLTLIAPDQPGAVEEEFHVTISESSEPLRFRSRGKVVSRTSAAAAARTPQPVPNASTVQVNR